MQKQRENRPNDGDLQKGFKVFVAKVNELLQGRPHKQPESKQTSLEDEGGVGDSVAMTDHDTFGLACRARCVLQEAE